MRYNDACFLENTIGMPQAHKQAFLDVARSQKCVILVRKTGPTCHGLLVEGYDTKGYRIHAKSCDWGPMAGFVMRDPRLNKYGMSKADFNRSKHNEAIEHDEENQGWKASCTPLKISRSRVQWLKQKGLISVTEKGGRLDGVATHHTGISFRYSLIPETGDLLGVYFDNTRLNERWTQEKGSTIVYYHAKWGSSYEPMLAMTNPPDHNGLHPSAPPHLKAVTGDYDLFAVWPYVEDYNADVNGEDHRPLGTVNGSITRDDRENVDQLERNFTTSRQGTKLGNITNRIYMVCQLINSIVGRNVLWHSDESARPFLDDVDLPVIAFNPAGSYFGIETIDDFKIYIAACIQEGLQVSLSDAWTQNPTAAKPNRLGVEYRRYVPINGVRIIAPDWYNK